MNSSRKSYEKRLDNFRQLILAWKTEGQIFDLYEKCHTPGQVISLFRHCFSGYDSTSHVGTILQLTDKQLIKMLRDIVPYSKQQHAINWQFIYVFMTSAILRRRTSLRSMEHIGMQTLVYIQKMI